MSLGLQPLLNRLVQSAAPSQVASWCSFVGNDRFLDRFPNFGNFRRYGGLRNGRWFGERRCMRRGRLGWPTGWGSVRRPANVFLLLGRRFLLCAPKRQFNFHPRRSKFSSRTRDDFLSPSSGLDRVGFGGE